MGASAPPQCVPAAQDPGGTCAARELAGRRVSGTSESVVALLAAPALAQISVPQQLAYEGRLAALDGTPSTGTHHLKFAIWPSQVGGPNLLWSDTLSVTVVNGLYSVTLGTTSGDPLPPTLFDGTVRYLEVTVDGDTLSPRQAIGSVPYSILSGGVQGGPVDATSYALNGNAFANDAGRTLIGVTTDAGRSVATVAGLFCGASAYTNGTVVDPGSKATGYRATKLLCEATCDSKTAHMCSGLEIVRSLELGIALDGGGDAQALWYSSGVNVPYMEGDIEQQIADCEGWTNSSSYYSGASWVLSPSFPGWVSCQIAGPIACCN